MKSGQTISTVKTGVGKGQYDQKYFGEMNFLGEDILKKVISVCKRRTGSAFLEKEMFSKLLETQGDRGKGGPPGRGGVGSRDGE